MEPLDAVIKVGGSLGRSATLPTLAATLTRLAVAYRLLVVPGGGASADVVRDYYRRYKLSETAAHRMALLAMDQYGCLLADLVPGSVLAADLASARSAAASGRAAILLPLGLLWGADPLPHSWQVTSDSLGAWLAGLVGARRYILLKDVDGLYPGGPPGPTPSAPYATLSLAQLAVHTGGVDGYLATVLTGLDLETWAINGLYPERLEELLATGTTFGTRIEGR